MNFPYFSIWNFSFKWSFSINIFIRLEMQKYGWNGVLLFIYIQDMTTVVTLLGKIYHQIAGTVLCCGSSVVNFPCQVFVLTSWLYSFLIKTLSNNVLLKMYNFRPEETMVSIFTLLVTPLHTDLEQHTLSGGFILWDFNIPHCSLMTFQFAHLFSGEED